MASIVEYRPGKFRANWRDQHGNPKSGPTRNSREDAEQWVQDNLAAVNRVTQLSKAFELWHGYHKSDYTLTATNLLAGVARRNKWTRIDQVTKSSIAKWIEECGGAKNPKGIVRHLQYLLTCLRWVNDTHHVPVAAEVLAMKGLRLPKKAKPELLTDDQVADIRECAWGYGPRAFAVIDYLLSYGARPITACRHQRRNLAAARKLLTIRAPKHSQDFVHPVTEQQVKLWLSLAYDDAPGDPLFPHYKEDRAWIIKRGSARELGDWYRNTIAKRLKLPKHQATIYRLKDWSMTKLLQHLRDPKRVCLFSGHLDAEQVLTYNTTNAESALQGLKGMPTLVGMKTRSTTKSKPKKGKKSMHANAHARMHTLKS